MLKSIGFFCSLKFHITEVIYVIKIIVSRTIKKMKKNRKPKKGNQKWKPVALFRFILLTRKVIIVEVITHQI